MSGFEDYFTSLNAREALTDLIIKVINEERPPYRYGIVDSVDTVNNMANVIFIGEPTPTPVQMGAAKVAVDQYVRVSGRLNDRYIDMPGGGGAGTPTIDMGEGGVVTGWSKPWYFHEDTVLTAIVSVVTAVDPLSVLGANVGKNTVVVGSISHPANQFVSVSPGPFLFEAGTRWQMQVHTASSVAQGLSFFGVS